MPWSVEDVDKHKKGLSSAQKQKWVDIANSVLRHCQQDGPPEGVESCEELAIRTASSRVGATQQRESEQVRAEEEMA